MSASHRSRSPNHIFAGLSARLGKQIAQHGDEVDVSYGQVLYEAHGKIEYAYFPLDCVVSLLASVDAERAAEVGMVGNEGMVGTPLLLGTNISPVRALVQGAGTVMRMEPRRLLQQVEAEKPFRQALLRFTHVLTAQFAQTAACNRFHLIDARLARWLLMTSDRLRATTFYLTQEYLSIMMGVRRESISEAARAMEEAGAIRYSRGTILIRDRHLLRQFACSCYTKPGTLPHN